MKLLQKPLLFCFVPLLLTSGTYGEAAQPLSGTWCIHEEGLEITFSPTDSLSVRGIDEPGIHGGGTFKKSDSLFTAHVVNGDVTIDIRYSYRWKDDTTIVARALLMTMNGDTMESPDTPVTMVRCHNQPEETPEDSSGTTKKPKEQL